MEGRKRKRRRKRSRKRRSLRKRRRRRKRRMEEEDRNGGVEGSSLSILLLLSVSWLMALGVEAVCEGRAEQGSEERRGKLGGWEERRSDGRKEGVKGGKEE